MKVDPGFAYLDDLGDEWTFTTVVTDLDPPQPLSAQEPLRGLFRVRLGFVSRFCLGCAAVLFRAGLPEGGQGSPVLTRNWTLAFAFKRRGD